MGVCEELQARGLIAQVTNEEEIRKMVNEGKAVFYIGFDPTADSLHVGHFVALMAMLVAKIYETIILHNGDRIKLGEMLKMAGEKK